MICHRLKHIILVTLQKGTLPRHEFNS